MPLVAQQNVVTISAPGDGAAKAVEKLRRELENYPPVRIISIAMKDFGSSMPGMFGTELVAVIETLPNPASPHAG